MYKDGEYKTVMKKNVTNPCLNKLFQITVMNAYKGSISEDCIISKVKNISPILVILCFDNIIKILIE